MLDKLPIRNNSTVFDLCSVCRKPETARHIFDCIFAREVRLMFGISLTKYVCTLDIISSFIHGLKKDANLF